MSIRVIKAEGGLGSQMLQVAFYIVLKEKKETVYFDLSNYTKNYDCHNGWEVEKIFSKLKLKTLTKGRNKPVKNFLIRLERYIAKKNSKIEKKSYYEIICSEFYKKYSLKYFNSIYDKKIEFHEVYANVGSKYDCNWYKKNKNTYYLNTYFSEKYFKEFEKIIKEYFIFPNVIDLQNLEILEKIKDKESVSIHVRRGDYVGNSVLGDLVNLDYYERAIDYIEKKISNPFYVIFSNDISWCQKNLKMNNKNIIYVDWNKGEKSFRDMQLMSLCKHNIIPNSGFSWWGAWLNKNLNKIVIAPEKWYSDSSQIPSDDVVPETWVKIKNY